MRRRPLYTRDADGNRVPMKNQLHRRTHGQCPYCFHFGKDCHCHKRKTMPASPSLDTIYLVIEDEPGHEYPSVVIGAHKTSAGAEAHVAYMRKERGLTDEDDYQDSNISWNIEQATVFP